jgi:S1-C subfamily serine protease
MFILRPTIIVFVVSFVTMAVAEAQSDISGRSGSSNILDVLNDEISSIVELARPSILIVEADFPYTGRKGYQFTVSGTGIAVRDHLLVTSSDLVDGKINFRIIDSKNITSEARLKAIDRLRGIAILESPVDLKPIKPGDPYELRLGNYLVIIGNSVNIPVASAVGTFNGFEDVEGRLNIAVNLSPGYSGGAVVNTSGELVGMLVGMNSDFVNLGTPFFESIITQSPDAASQSLYTQVAQQRMGVRTPISSAVAARPVDDIITAVDMLEKKGGILHGFLGVSPRDIGKWRKNIENYKMILVTHITPGSPADLAGIREDAYIITYNGKQVNSTAQLFYLVKTTPPGSVIDMTVLQDDTLESYGVEISQADESSGMTALAGTDAEIPGRKALIEAKFRELEETALKMRQKWEIRNRIDYLNTQMQMIQDEIKRLSSQVQQVEEDK